MTHEGVTRRLAAIVAADMVGYSRLMQLDEAGIVTRQKACLDELVNPKFNEHGGRLVKTTGDGYLVEFPSAVDAVLCAVAVQREMADREADIPEDRRIVYRVGINLGEIIIDGNDIFGDGVNVAARLEALAEPGGIRISRAVFNNVKGKLDLGFADLGLQQVKNIDEPIAMYQILLDPADAGTVVEGAGVKTGQKKSLRMQVAALLAFFFVGVIAGGLFWTEPWIQRVEAAVVENMAFELPDEPSIAIMPFENLSGDPEQDYLADGIVDSIITALAKTEQLFVVARNSTFTFKGKPYLVKEVAEKFGVRHVVEGSFQKTEETVRITARLIDALSGRQIWADTFDRKMSNIFVLQDDITTSIVEELQIKLTVGEQGRIWRRATSSAEAYQLMLKSLEFWHRFTPEANAMSRDFAEQALALDPKFAAAEGMRSISFFNEFYNGWVQDRALAFSQSVESSEKAMAMGDDSLYSQSGFILLYKGERDKALAAAEKGVTLHPGKASAATSYANVLVMDGRHPEEAIKWFNRSKRLNPNLSAWEYWTLSEALRQLGRYDEMIEVATNILNETNSAYWWERPRLAFAYMKLGHEEEARAQLKEWLTEYPEGAQAYLTAIKTFPKPLYDDTVETLVRAGFPNSGKSED